MHAVDRGPEPPSLAAVRKRLTPKWVAYYHNGRGRKPTDSQWRQFQPDVSRAFSGLCGYCEESCKGDVDHFRPKSRFPDRVYSWENWVLACHTCNSSKLDKWPPSGYVDPCAKSSTKRPESFFDFDTKTGQILPKKSLSVARRARDQQTINDLKLNAGFHLTTRTHLLEALAMALKGVPPGAPRVAGLAKHLTARSKPTSSVVRAWLIENGFGSALA